MANLDFGINVNKAPIIELAAFINKLDEAIKKDKLSIDELAKSSSILTKIESMAVTSTGELSHSFEGFGKSAGKIPDLLKNINAQLEKTKVVAPKVSNELKTLNTTTDNTVNVAGQSRAALLSVSQAIQDAPYGIRGMSNNIDFLVQQFLYLKVAAGSTSGAMAALGTAFKGVSAWLIGISLISAAINYFSNLKTKTDDAKKSQDDLTESVKKYIEEIEGLVSGRNVEAKVGILTTQVASYSKMRTVLEGILSEVERGIQPTIAEGEERALTQYGLKVGVVNIEELKNAIKKNNELLEIDKKKLEIAKTYINLTTIYSKKDESTKKNKETEEDLVGIALKKYELGKVNLLNTIAELGTIRDLTASTEKKLEIDLQIKELRDNSNQKQKDFQESNVDFIIETSELEYEKKTITEEQLISYYKIALIEAETLGLIDKQLQIRKKIKDAEKETKKETTATQKALKKIGDVSFNMVVDSFDQIINKIDITDKKLGLASITMKSFVNSFLNELAKLILKMVIVAGLAALLAPFTGGGSMIGGMLGNEGGGVMSFVDVFSKMMGFSKKAQGGYINEPIYGVGASGQRYMFGEKGSELIIPNNRLANNMNNNYAMGGQNMNVIVTGKIKGKDIYLSNLKYNNSLSTLSI